MLKRAAIATVAVFVAWEILDMIVHGGILGATYESQPELWRPMGEMMMWLIFVVVLVTASCFTAIYTWFISPKSLKVGVYYGLIFGIGVGISMGYGTYASMPVPYHMALAWFLNTVVQGVLGGLIVALIVKEPAAEAGAASGTPEPVAQ